MYTNMFETLKRLDIVYLLTCNNIYRDEHYTILDLMKNLKLASILQMLSWDFSAFDIFSWFV